MEETLTTGSTVSMETDLNMEYSSDTNNDSEDENSDVEITFGPWPPFPSKQNTEIPEDELVSKLDLQDVDYSDVCEEEQDVDVESDGSEVSLDDHVDLESVENYTKTDDVTSQYVQSEESEMVDVVGPHEVADFIPEDTEAETDTDRYLASAVESTDITTDMASLPTECDDVISNCVPSDSAASLYTNDTVSSDVQGTQPPTEPSIVIKEEPNLDGYPDSSPPPEIPKDDNLFVSTEHGKMFIRSVATRPSDNEENEFDKTESSTETIQLARSRSIADGSDKKTPKPVRVYVVKKTNFQEEETDNYRTDELKPGRIIGKNPGKKIIAIMDPAKGSTESDESHLHRQVLLPKTKTGKNKKISRKLKESEVMKQGAGKITRKRKVISSDLSSPPISGDDRTPDNQVLYNLRAKPADKEMGSLTVDNCQVDLSRVKTEPEDYSEQNQDNTATVAGIHEADPTSWIKKEPLTEDGGHVENAMESHMPVPVKLIRNEVVNTLAPDITIGNGFMTGAISQQESSSSKVFKKPASIMVGGRPVTLQSGQKIIYTLPKGGQPLVQSGGGSNQQKVVKVIKLNNLKNAPSVVPLTGNLKLFRLQKTPTVSSCEGKEIPLSSVLNHKKVTLTGETAENAKEDQDKKNLMLKKIDGIIKKNLELMKKNQVPTKKKVSLSSENTTIVTPQWSEGIDENTGKTTMILMPNVAQQKKIQTNKVIYRFDDRSKRSKKNKKDADISLSKNPITSSSTASPFTASSNMIPVSLPVKVTKPTVRKKPAMCDGFTQTKKDHPSVKKQVSGKAVMVKDACFQTDTFPENNKITDEDMSQETTANSSEVTSTSPTKPMATNSDDTDLVMDVENVDSVTSKTMPSLDPITVPRPMWKWTGRDTSSIGVNTGEASRDDEDSTSPVEHQYAFAASKEKQRYGLFDMASVTEKVKPRKQCLKLQKMKKSIRRQTFLKNKEWEFDCKVTLLKQKLEDQKKSSSDNKTDKSVENKGPSVDMADEQIKHEENKDPMHDGSVGSMMGKKGESKEKTADAKSSGNTKSAVTELRTRSSSRIKYRQAVALRNADMTSFFERCQMKLGDVEDIADLESTPYITDSSDEDWKQMISGLPPFNDEVDLISINQSVPDDQDQSLPDNKDQSLPDNKDQSLPDNKDQGLPDDQDQSLPDDQDQSLPDGHDQSLPDDQDQSLHDNQDQSLSDDQDQSQRMLSENVYALCVPEEDRMVEDVYVLCVPEEDRMELYLMCSPDTDLQEEGTRVYLICTDDIKFDKYTTVVWRKGFNQVQVDVNSEEDIVLEIKNEKEDLQENAAESSLVENLIFDRNSSRNQSYSSHDKPGNVTLLSPFCFTSMDPYQSLKMKTMLALSLKPVSTTSVLPPQEGMQILKRNKIPPLPGSLIPPLPGSLEDKEMEKSLSVSFCANEFDLFTRPENAKERSHTLRHQEGKERSPMLTLPQYIKERSTTVRQHQTEDLSPITIQEDPKDKSQFVQEVEMSSLASNNGKLQECSKAKVEIMCCNISSTDHRKTVDSTNKTEKVTESDERNEVTACLGAGFRVVGTHKLTNNHGALVVEVEETDVNNNECPLLDSPEFTCTVTEYEYTSADDCLYSEPLDLSIKPSKDRNSVPYNLAQSYDDEFDRQNVKFLPSVWLTAESSFHSMPIAESNHHSRPTVESNLHSRQAVESNLNSRPTVESNLHSRPTVESNFHSRPTVESNLHSRPTVESNFYSRPTVESNFHSRPTAESSLHSRPAVYSNCDTRPTVNSDLFSRSNVYFDLPSKPTMDSTVICSVWENNGYDNIRKEDTVGERFNYPQSHMLKQGRSSAHINDGRDFCRSCPENMDIDENANQTGIDVNNNVQQCWNGTGIGHQSNISGSALQLKNNRSQCGDRVQGRYLLREEDVCPQKSQSWSQTQPTDIIQLENRDKMLNPYLGSRIQNTFTSDGDRPWLNSNLHHYQKDHKMHHYDKDNMTSDRTKYGLYTHSWNVSQEKRKVPALTPQNSQDVYNVSIDRHLEPEAHERMLMHMMYTPQSVRACNNSDLNIKHPETSGQSDHSVESAKVKHPRPCPTRITFNCRDNNVPLDLSCNENHTILRESCNENHTILRESCNENHTILRESCNENHTILRESCNENHTILRESCNENHTMLRESCNENHTMLRESCNENHTILRESCNENHTILREYFEDQPNGKTSVPYSQPKETNNGMSNVQKFNPQFSLAPDILKNLRLPDNIPELLRQRAVPMPDPITNGQQHESPLLGRTHPTAAGVITYNPVSDVLPRTYNTTTTYTKHLSTSPGSEQLPERVLESLGGSKTQVRRRGISKNPTRKRLRAKTKNDYTGLSCCGSNQSEVTTAGSSHLMSVKSGTSCTSFHVQPLVQTYPAMPHRHFIPADRSRPIQHQQPPSVPVVPQQPFYFDNHLRRNPPGFLDQQIAVSSHELLRPYMAPLDKNLKRTYSTMNNEFQNPYNSHNLPCNVKFPERRMENSGGMFFRGEKQFICNQNPDPWSSFQVDKRVYPPQQRDLGKLGQHQTPLVGNPAQPVAPANWRQSWSNDNLRYQQDLNQTQLCGNHMTDSQQDYHGNMAAAVQPGKPSFEMSNPAVNSRISQITGIVDDCRKETGGPCRNLELSMKARKKTSRQRSKRGRTDSLSLEQTDVEKFVGRSLAVTHGVTIRQHETHPADHRNMGSGSCCRCWSRGKCRSCVCSKIGCQNCRNPLCCFKETSPSQEKIRRRCRSSVKSRKSSEKQHNEQNFSNEQNDVHNLAVDATESCTTTNISHVTSNRHTTTVTHGSQTSCATSFKFATQTSNATSSSYAAQTSNAITVGYATQTSTASQTFIHNDQRRASVQTNAIQGENRNTCLSRILQQDPKTTYIPDPLVERNRLLGSHWRYEPPDHVTEMNLVKGLSGKFEPAPLIKEDEMLMSDMEKRLQMPVRTLVTSNQSSCTAVISNSLIVDDKLDKKVQGQESATTLENRNKIDGALSNEKQSYRIEPTCVDGLMAHYSMTNNKAGSSGRYKITAGTNKKVRRKKGKENKNGGADERMKIRSHQNLKEQNLDKNNNVECNLRTSNNGMVSDTGIREGLKKNGLGDGIDLNNNDLCCTNSAELMLDSRQQAGQSEMEKKKNPPKSKRQKSRSEKETDNRTESDVILKEQHENDGNITKKGFSGDMKQDGVTVAKKGRPRTRPMKQPKKFTPEVLIKLEDHKDKYEVTQFTSFHKKDRNIEVGLKSFERFTCRLCCGMYQYNTPDRTSMEEHLAQHLSGRLTCADCGQTFSQAIHVQEHRQKTHRTANFTCELCAKQFFTSTTLKRHLCKAHGHKLFTCKQCPERYSSVEEVKMHVYKVHGGEATKCEKCGVILLSSKAAASHAKSKMCIGQEESNVPCPHCNRILSVSQMAHHVKRIHLRVHTYKCDQCPYTTLARTALNNHMMMHQGVHPFRCELCPFSCVKSYQLSSHMRTHTGDKPYRCDQCSYAAAWNVQLKDHMRAHTSPHSILCEECGILFKDGRCLNLHNKKVHKNKQEVKVTKREKVKDKYTRQTRQSKMKAVKETVSQ